MNLAFLRFRGYRAHEIQGRDIGDFAHPEEPDPARLHFRKTLARGRSYG